MMLKQGPLRVLVWKDVSVVAPLALGLAGLLVGIVAIAGVTMDRMSSSILTNCLILFPSLAALGAPILLLGHEEETGTLNWQRALPMDWRTVWFSKWVAVCFAVFVVWMGALIASGIAKLLGVSVSILLFGVGSEWLEFHRVLSTTFLLLGIVVLVSWFFRGPAVALLAVVPTAILAIAIAILTGTWFFVRYKDALGAQGPNGNALFVGLVQWLMFAVLVVLSAWVAKARWLKSESPADRFLGMLSRGSDHDSHLAYTPARPLASTSPGIRRALLWQWRQQAKGYIWGVCVIVLFLSLSPVLYPYDNSWDSWAILMMVLANGLLGVSVFIGDTTKERHRYLAQLGVSRWTSWWTRFIQPAALFVVLNGLFFASGTVIPHASGDAAPLSFAFQRSIGEGVLFLLVDSVLPLVMGMISAMWARRPIVGALAHLVLTGLSFVCGAMVFAIYPEYPLAVVPPLLVLFALTIRMQGRWLDGERGIRYGWRFMGWLGISAAVLFVSVAIQRFAGTPALDPQWREQTYAAASALSPLTSQPVYVRFQLRPSSDTGLSEVDWGMEQDSQQELREVIALVQAGERMRVEEYYSVTLDRVFADGFSAARLGESGPFGSEHRFWYMGLLDVGFRSMECCVGTMWLIDSDRADEWELRLANELGLDASRKYLGEEAWSGYVERLRTPKQRTQDRRRALLYSWRYLHPLNVIYGRPGESREATDVDIDKVLLGFGGYQVYRQDRLHLAFEWDRAARYIDGATRLGLSQLESGLAVLRGGPEEASRIELWEEALQFRPTNGVWGSYIPTRNWTRSFEDQIESVRAKLPSDEEDSV